MSNDLPDEYENYGYVKLHERPALCIDKNVGEFEIVDQKIRWRRVLQPKDKITVESFVGAKREENEEIDQYYNVYKDTENEILITDSSVYVTLECENRW